MDVARSSLFMPRCSRRHSREDTPTASCVGAGTKRKIWQLLYWIEVEQGLQALEAFPHLQAKFSEELAVAVSESQHHELHFENNLLRIDRRFQEAP